MSDLLGYIVTSSSGTAIQRSSVGPNFNSGLAFMGEPVYVGDVIAVAPGATLILQCSQSTLNISVDTNMPTQTYTTDQIQQLVNCPPYTDWAGWFLASILPGGVLEGDAAGLIGGLVTVSNTEQAIKTYFDSIVANIAPPDTNENDFLYDFDTDYFYDTGISGGGGDVGCNDPSCYDPCWPDYCFDV